MHVTNSSMSKHSFTYSTVTHSFTPPLHPPSATLLLSPIPPLFTDLLNLHSNKRDKGDWTAFSLSPLLKGNKHTYTRLQSFIPQRHRPKVDALISTSISLYISQFLYHYLLSLLLVCFSPFRSPRKDPYWY